MDRRKFLKRFGFGVAGAVVATKVAIEVSKEYPVELAPETQPVLSKGIMGQIEDANTFTVYSDRRGVDAFQKALEQSWKKTPQSNSEKYWEEYMQIAMDAKRYERLKKI